MTATTTDTAPRAPLFDVTEFTRRAVEGRFEMVPLEQIELADNPRKDIDQSGIERLAKMLMVSGQLVPLIGQRVGEETVLAYDGQRRYLAARASHDLAGSDGFEGLKPVQGLMFVLLDHAPTEEEKRRIQAQANAREDLSRRDQQDQFRDCWQSRAGVPDKQRMALVCEDLGIAMQKGHHLLREIALPDPIRERVSEKPAGDGLSVKMAGRLADMHAVAPELTDAVAARITSRDLHDRAQEDMGAFVHLTVVEDEHVYAVRIEDGGMLDAHKQLEDARAHLGTGQVDQVAQVLECKSDEVERKLDELAATARRKALMLRVDGLLRDRAANGNYAYVYDRGADLAPSMWIIDPVFTIGLVHEQLKDADATVAQEETYFGSADVKDEESSQAADAERARREAERERQRASAAANTGLGIDIKAKLMDATEAQMHGLRDLICHMLVEHYPELIAYGAGWTDERNMQPVGDSTRLEPRSIDAILGNELQRALDDKDPLRGIAQLAARLCAAFVLDPTGVTKTKSLGHDRMARKVRDALPGGEHPLRTATWAFMRPMLSPHLVTLNHDDFVGDESAPTTVDLAAHREDSALEDLDLGDDDTLPDAG